LAKNIFLEIFVTNLCILRRIETFEEKDRLPAKELLKHPWLTVEDKGASCTQVISPKAIANLKQFHSMHIFKRLVLTVIATQLNEQEKQSLKGTFWALDKEGDGTSNLSIRIHKK